MRAALRLDWRARLLLLVTCFSATHAPPPLPRVRSRATLSSFSESQCSSRLSWRRDVAIFRRSSCPRRRPASGRVCAPLREVQVRGPGRGFPAGALAARSRCWTAPPRPSRRSGPSSGWRSASRGSPNPFSAASSSGPSRGTSGRYACTRRFSAVQRPRSLRRLRGAPLRPAGPPEVPEPRPPRRGARAPRALARAQALTDSRSGAGSAFWKWAAWKTSCKSVSAPPQPVPGGSPFVYRIPRNGSKKKGRSCFRSFWRPYSPNGATPQPLLLPLFFFSI